MICLTRFKGGDGMNIKLFQNKEEEVTPAIFNEHTSLPF